MRPYDTIVVGAGIQGLLVALECSASGQRVLLVDKGGAGRATTDNSFGIVHGGLRYLQRLDLGRWRRSRREQGWFLREFPDLAAPLACVMPLYKGAFRSPMAFSAAFGLEKLLSRDLDVPDTLPQGSILPAAAVLANFPCIDANGLLGAAQWHDVALLNPAALVERLVSRFTGAGGEMAQNHEVIGFSNRHGKATGVSMRNARTGQSLTCAADTIVLCVGPWSEALTQSAGLTDKRLACKALAFNLLLDIEPQFTQGLAVSVRAGRGRSYFVRPHNGKLLAGTYYVERSGAEPNEVGAAAIAAFKSDLQRCLPGLNIREAEVLRVMAGSLPGRAANRLTSSDVLVDHGAAGGVRGIFTVLGVKLTTSRTLAEKAVQMIHPPSGSTGTVMRPVGQ
jgi:glycerol-3-phosphate dehydrogenase